MTGTSITRSRRLGRKALQGGLRYYELGTVTPVPRDVKILEARGDKLELRRTSTEEKKTRKWALKKERSIVVVRLYWIWMSANFLMVPGVMTDPPP